MGRAVSWLVVAVVQGVIAAGEWWSLNEGGCRLHHCKGLLSAGARGRALLGGGGVLLNATIAWCP